MNKRTLSIFCTALFFTSLVSSAFGYEKEIEQLSSQMAEKIAAKGKKTVAVVDFTDLEGNVTQLDQFIAEEFSVALASAGKGFRVIDRTRLKIIIKENKLAATGLIDPATASKLGKIAGVDALVTGTLTPFGDNVRLTVKVLDSETADIIDSAKSNFAKTQAIDELLGKEMKTASANEGRTKKIEAKPAQEKGEISGAFSDDFNAGPKPDWKPISGNWTMSNGQYIISDINIKETYLTFLEGKSWRNLSMDIDVTPGDATASSGSFKLNICPRIISQTERVCFGMNSGDNKFEEAYWLIIKEGMKGEPIGRVEIETSSGQSVHVKIEVKNGVFTAYVNGAKVSQIYDISYPSGSVGIGQWYGWWGNEKIRMGFDNVEIKPLAD